MKILIRITIMLGLLLSSVSSYDIVTGGQTGTYIKFGQQIKSYVTDNTDLSLNVLTSKGSVDNLNRMSVDENIRFAIVQHDVINDFKSSNNDDMRMLIRNIKVLLPLYFEEIHFVVKKNSSMNYIKDIYNKKINAGTRGSGTFMTTALLYNELFSKHISNQNLTNFSKKEAFVNLLSGNTDVVVIVAGQPSETIENLSSDFKLLKLNPGLSSDNYYPTTIKANSYSWLNQNVSTFAVKAYLITYDTSSKRFEGQLRRVAKEFRTNMKLLRKEGHPKWKKVNEDLSKKLPAGWEYYEPFRDAWKYAKCTEEEELMGLCK